MPVYVCPVSNFSFDKGWVLRLVLGVLALNDENQENGTIIKTTHSHFLDYSFNKDATPVMLIAKYSQRALTPNRHWYLITNVQKATIHHPWTIRRSFQSLAKTSPITPSNILNL